ncbi:MAG: DinB family protein [Acidipila sp.]|nr:DinB family protein [Acidipila sp.]
MRTTYCMMMFLCLAAFSGMVQAQTDRPGNRMIAGGRDGGAAEQHTGEGAPTLDAQREKRALAIFAKLIEKEIVSAAEAMPADKYGFAPSAGEFKGVRTFAQQVKHLAATNHILAAAALGEPAPTSAGDEAGPETVRTKTEILDYLKESFAHLGKAIEAIGEKSRAVKSSPISPLPAGAETRLALTVEALVHAFDHYGQMVEYLRMNGVVPPASRS